MMGEITGSSACWDTRTPRRPAPRNMTRMSLQFSDRNGPTSSKSGMGPVMALLSDQSRATRAVELPRDVPVIDVIEMKPGRGLIHAPGMVAVLENFPVSDPEVYVGR